MKKKEEQWTCKEILKGKTLQVIVLTVFFTWIINQGANKLLIYWLNRDNTSIMQYNYSFGIVGAIFIIPALLLSLGIIKMILNIRGVVAPGATSQLVAYKTKRKQNQEKQFKWYSIYGIVLGYFFLGFIVNMSKNKWANHLDIVNELNTNIYLRVFFYVVMMITCMIVTILAVKILNKIMIKITGTNKELLQDINEGLYNLNFLTVQERNQTIKLLEIGRLSSVRGALIYLKLQRWLKTIGKASIFIGSIIYIITAGVINVIGDAFTEAIRGMGGTFSAGGNGATQAEKDRAMREANQKRKKADHALDQANKQLAYNPNTYYMKEKYHYAKQTHHDAEDAKRKARNM